MAFESTGRAVLELFKAMPYSDRQRLISTLLANVDANRVVNSVLPMAFELLPLNVPDGVYKDMLRAFMHRAAIAALSNAQATGNITPSKPVDVSGLGNFGTLSAVTVPQSSKAGVNYIPTLENSLERISGDILSGDLDLEDLVMIHGSLSDPNLLEGGKLFKKIGGFFKKVGKKAKKILKPVGRIIKKAIPAVVGLIPGVGPLAKKAVKGAIGLVEKVVKKAKAKKQSSAPRPQTSPAPKPPPAPLPRAAPVVAKAPKASTLPPVKPAPPPTGEGVQSYERRRDDMIRRLGSRDKYYQYMISRFGAMSGDMLTGNIGVFGRLASVARSYATPFVNKVGTFFKNAMGSPVGQGIITGAAFAGGDAAVNSVLNADDDPLTWSESVQDAALQDMGAYMDQRAQQNIVGPPPPPVIPPPVLPTTPSPMPSQSPAQGQQYMSLQAGPFRVEADEIDYAMASPNLAALMNEGKALYQSWLQTVAVIKPDMIEPGNFTGDPNAKTGVLYLNYSETGIPMISSDAKTYGLSSILSGIRTSQLELVPNTPELRKLNLNEDRRLSAEEFQSLIEAWTHPRQFKWKSAGGSKFRRLRPLSASVRTSEDKIQGDLTSTESRQQMSNLMNKQLSDLVGDMDDMAVMSDDCTFSGEVLALEGGIPVFLSSVPRQGLGFDNGEGEGGYDD